MPRRADLTTESAPGAGVRNKFAADRAASLHPSARNLDNCLLLTQGRPGLMQGSGDARPPTLRPGSTLFQTLPSRMSNTLRWPDGRVTDLAGAPITTCSRR